MQANDQSREQGIEIASLFACVLVGIGLYPLLGDDGEANILLIQIAFILLLVGVLKPSALSPVYKYWMKLAVVLHKIVSPLVLGLMFGLIFVPTSIALRIFKKDLLRTSEENLGRDTFWRPKNREIPFDMTKQF